MRSLIAIMSFLMLAGCSEGTGSDCVPGSEGCACNEGQCLVGLECLSDLCVSPGTGGAGGIGGTTATGGSGGGGGAAGNVGSGGTAGNGGSGGIPLCTSSAECDDGDLCTDDSCDPSVGCVFLPKSCSDSNFCTDDTCEPATGHCSSSNKANGANCDFAEHCEPGVICEPIPGSCVLGSCIFCTTNGSCSDLNPCTVETCDSGLCSWENAPNGTPCTTQGAAGTCFLGRCRPAIGGL